MAFSRQICRIRVALKETTDLNLDRIPRSGQAGETTSRIVDIRDCPNVTDEARIQWAQGILEHLTQSKESVDDARKNYVRPWDFLVTEDGSVVKLPPTDIPIPPAPQQTVIGTHCYPSCFQIPPETLQGLSIQNQIERYEAFAIGSILYEVLSGRKPFEDLDTKEAQRRFQIGEFPEDARSLPLSILIYMCWSQEFAKFLDSQKPSVLQRVAEHAKAHPYSTAVAATGLVIGGVTLAAPAALGWVGFTSVGPAAASYASAWQASIGAVKAGSVFAWFQSAAMGGTAATQIAAVGAAGAGLAAAGGGVGVGQAAMRKARGRLEDYPELMEMFGKVYRTVDMAQMQEKENVNAGNNKQPSP